MKSRGLLLTLLCAMTQMNAGTLPEGTVLFAESFDEVKQWSTGAFATATQNTMTIRAGTSAHRDSGNGEILEQDVFGDQTRATTDNYTITRGIYSFLKEAKGYEAELSFEAKAEDVPRPAEPWEGIRIALNYATEVDNYADSYNGLSGTFPWRSFRLKTRIPSNLRSASLTIGILGKQGSVSFRNVKITVTGPPLATLCRDDAPPPYKGHDLKALRGFNTCDNILKDDRIGKAVKEWNVNLLKLHLHLKKIPFGLPDAELEKHLEPTFRKWDKALEEAGQAGTFLIFQAFAPWREKNDWAHSDLFYTRPGYAEYFVKIWEKIAARYKGNRRIHAFELLNESCLRIEKQPGFPDYEELMERTARAINAIDPERTILVQPEEWFGCRAFETLRPIRAKNIVYAVHFYLPFPYTHQRIGKGRAQQITYPGECQGRYWDKSMLRKALQPVRDFQKAHNVHMLVSEFSAIASAPNREKYLNDLIELFEEYNWDWTFHAYLEFYGWSPDYIAAPGYEQRKWTDAKSWIPRPDNPTAKVLKRFFHENELRRKAFDRAKFDREYPPSPGAAHSGTVFVTADAGNTLRPEPMRDRPGRCTHPTWNRKAVWAVTPQLPEEKWVPFSFAFTPEKDGEITLTLLVNDSVNRANKTKTPCTLAWDNLSLDGASLVNGGFELRDAKGRYTSWPWIGGGTFQHETISPRNGKRMLVLKGKQQAAQRRIKVKGGEKVTFRGFVRVVGNAGDDSKNLQQPSSKQN